MIIDEEHDPSFKQQEPAPRYNARDTAIFYASRLGAKVLLGSATPSMETYANVRTGKYGLVELFERFGNVLLPEIEMVDTRLVERKGKEKLMISPQLQTEIEEAVKHKKQVILFQNRRGYTPLWMCEICNWTPKCKNCDVSLTYHKQTNTLKCHYCGYLTPPVGTCSCCGSNRLKMLGFGTEKIEDDLSLIFPNIRIQRMDLDTTRSKNAYENIISEFENRNVDVLIGTQMVTKGLDFDNVSLVGILDADMLLNRNDFRAFERSYQLMSQVAGRSGRKNKRGSVIIQTGDVDNWVIQKVIAHDYKGFYESEIVERKNYFYPPFYKIIEFTLKHKDENLVNQASNEFAKSLREIFKERVLGPEFPVVARVNNQFIKVIKLKIERDAPEKKIKERINELIDSFYSAPVNKSIRLLIDVDPA